MSPAKGLAFVPAQETVAMVEERDPNHFPNLTNIKGQQVWSVRGVHEASS